MKKMLFYGMTGEKSCFLHVLLNAAQLHEAGHEVKLIFEGASVKLVPVLEKEKNPVYLKIKEAGLIAGICLACSKVLGVYEDCVATGLPMLSDMSGHAGIMPFIQDGYEVISI
ncbi:MAG: hypothetical protein GXZ04_00440 [Clostridiales bacterium]|nr:hypothetical protein [Clostridiales bacterium]